MKIVIPNGDYSYNASTKQITLSPPYNTISLEQIYSIFNFTRSENIYVAGSVSSPKLTSVAAGVITHTYSSAGNANGDILIITIDSSAIDGGTP